MKNKISIGLAEDNPSLVKSIAANLRIFEEVNLVFVAFNGQEALQEIELHRPDVVLMDINMPVMNGIEATTIATKKYIGTKIIMLTVFDENDKIFESILSGASGYLLKDEKPYRIIEAIKEVLEGGAPMSPSIAHKTMQLLRYSVSGNSSKEEAAKQFNLSNREFEVLQYVAEGLTYQHIADKLFISPKTVGKHIENIYNKLQVNNKVAAIQLAREAKII